MLENVYDQATNNYQGSAQNELNTYLDSIEAKTTKIKESWSQLWQSDETTSAYKFLLDVGNDALNLFSKAGIGNILGGGAGIGISKLLNWGGTNYQLVL